MMQRKQNEAHTAQCPMSTYGRDSPSLPAPNKSAERTGKSRRGKKEDGEWGEAGA